MYADYVVRLRIEWPCFLPKIVKIRAAVLKLLAEMCGPVAFGPPCIYTFICRGCDVLFCVIVEND